MKIWVDAQLSPAIAAWINRTFDDIEAESVRSLGFRDATDLDIFEAARKADVVVMSKDDDFIQPRRTTTNSSEPSFDNSITLNENAIDVQWNAETGSHSFAVWMDADSEGNPVHNNIHLIKLEENTDLDEVNSWLDWYKVGGIKSPSPVDFLVMLVHMMRFPVKVRLTFL